MKYRKLHFYVNKLEHCCGAFVVSGFAEEQNRRNWQTNQMIEAKSFDTVADVLKDFDVSLANSLQECISTDRGYAGKYLLMCTLVEKYQEYGPKDGQLPYLREHLLKNGWEITKRWVNANSGNTVIMLSCFLEEDEVESLRVKEEEHDF